MAARFSANTMKMRRTTSLPSTTIYTIMAWIQISVDQNAITPFFYRTSNSANPYVYWGCDSTGTTHQVDYNPSNGTSTGNATGTNLAVGTWYHVALVVNDPSAKAYLNGNLDISVTRSNTFTLTNDQITIGHDDDTDNEFFNGRMAAVKVWSGVALSQAEIRLEMLCNAPVRAANLYLWSPLLTGTDGRDFSGSGRDWTVSGSITTEADPSIYWTTPASPAVPYFAGIPAAQDPIFPGMMSVP